MNQILEYSPNKNSGGGSSGSDKIVRIFALILIVFALCFIGIGGYGFVKKNKTTADAGTVTQTEAKIEIEKLESTALIKVSHDKAIEKVIYSWDSDKEIVEKGDGTSAKEIEIPLPAGQHTLTVKAVDIDGVETSYKKDITSENGTDIINPEIKIVVTEDKKLKITATDETEIAYVTYKWNNEEETVMDEKDETGKTIEFEIEILKGNNDLTVIAVDANNRTTTENKTFAGVTKPEVKITVASDKKSINVNCSHENGLKKIMLNANGKDYEVGLDGGTPSDANFDFALPEGNVTIKVTATSIDDTVTEATEEIVPDEPETSSSNENIMISIGKSVENTNKALISAEYSEGIKDLKLNVNDQDYGVGLPEENPTNLSFELDLVEGNNRITVTVIGTDGTENTKVEELSGE